MAYIGNDLQVAYPSYTNIDDISGSFDGVTTSFSLLVNGSAPVPLPLSSNQCLISVGGVIQRPDDSGTEGFRLSGGNIIFSSAPSSGEDFFGVILAGADYVNAGVNFPDGTLGAPSITFDQDNDTGYYRSASGAISFSSNGVASGTWNANGVSAPALIPSGSTVPSNGVYLPSANNVGIATNSTAAITVDSSQRVGIGTTSPARLLTLNATEPMIQFTNPTTGTTANDGTLLYQSSENFNLELQDSGFFRIYTGGSERVRLDSSGRLLVGTSTANGTNQLQIEGSLGSNISLRRGEAPGNITSGEFIGGIEFQDNAEHIFGIIECRADANAGTNDYPGRLVFSTTADGASSPTERVRITNLGQFNAFSANNVSTILGRNSAGAGTTVATYIGVHSATGTTDGTISCYIWSNGNVQNTNGSYTTISDVRLKENIVDAGSQWNDLKAIKIRNWNFKAETGHETHRQIGPIAQELETVCPGLVFETPDRDEDGNETGEVTKGVNQSVLYMKAVKALQEAMERIEQLETEMAAVKAKLP